MPKELKNLMEAESKVALVVGALGVIGRNLIEHLSGLDDWEIVGLSRRAPDFKTKAQFISVNLHDPDGCREKLGGLRNVTGNRAHSGPGRRCDHRWCVVLQSETP
jgi:nucleoside-diphosphate-sugar epimerase